jgi:hypothetical protein
MTIPELRRDLLFFCANCQQRVHRVIEVIEIDAERQSYVKCLWCLRCVMEGKGKI